MLTSKFISILSRVGALVGTVLTVLAVVFVANNIPRRQPASATSWRADGTGVLAVMNAKATYFGEARPSHIEWVLSTRGKAVAVTTGDEINSDRDRSVLVIEALGSFIANDAKVPPGGALPTGSYLTIILDNATGAILDTALSPNHLSLVSLNVVRTVP
jgi:hypothetical protein